MTSCSAGFVSAARERQLDVDLVFAAIELQQVIDRSVLVRVRQELILPARSLGCAVWLGGISLGGYLALCCAERHAAGACRPLRVRALSRQSHRHGRNRACPRVSRAGSPPELASDDDERRVWRFIKSLRSGALAVHLGLGSEDRFGARHRLMAAALAPTGRGHRERRSRLADLAAAVGKISGCAPGAPPLGRLVSSRSRAPDEGLPDARSAARLAACPARSWRASPAHPRLGRAACRRGGRGAGAPARGGPGRSRRWWPIICCSRPRGCGRGAAGSGRTGRACPRPRDRPAPASASAIGPAGAVPGTLPRQPQSPSPSTTVPIPSVTARVLDVLDEHGARATFFCIGERVARHPALARAIVARHHEIGNHSHRHLKRFSLLGPRGSERGDPSRAGGDP